MIHESSPWKAALVRDGELIARWAEKPPSGRRAFLIERKLILAAYSLRKLSDDHKLSTATLKASIKVKLSKPLSQGFSNILHWLDRYFDLDNPVTLTLTWRRILNMMIHSAAFAEVQDDAGRCVGFLVTSDQELQRGLVHVELSDFLRLIEIAANDYPTEIRQMWHPAEGRWVTWAGKGGELA